MASRFRIGLALGAALLLGCGDDATSTDTTGNGTTSGPGCTLEECTVSDSGTTAGMVTGQDSTSVGASDGPGSSGSDGDSGSATGTGTSTGDTSTGDGTTDDSGSDSTGAQGNVVYSAEALPGGLDRVRIFKRDLDADRCTWIVLVAPPIAGMYPVTTPAGWSVESISISDVGMACDSASPAMFGSEPATAAVGDVTFAMVGAIYPCEVDLDVTADFAGILPGIPAQDTMNAAAIPVTGC